MSERSCKKEEMKMALRNSKGGRPSIYLAPSYARPDLDNWVRVKIRPSAFICIPKVYVSKIDSSEFKPSSVQTLRSARSSYSAHKS